MAAIALEPRRFVRRTTLAANEYRKNFQQIDCDTITAVTSAEADRVTPLMSKIYLRLVSAPAEFWERQGLLYFSPREGDDGRQVKASKVLYEVLGVASATAHKALAWMHEQGIIGYSSAKNGAGIRIFLNHGSNVKPHGSSAEPAFKDSFADQETLELTINPHAPKNGADERTVVNSIPAGASAVTTSLGETVNVLLDKLRPVVHAAATEAAAREHEKTREWLENRGLPKAARVAQREAYSVLRQYGVIAPIRTKGNSSGVGRTDVAHAPIESLSPEEVEEFAEICVMMLASHDQPINETLAEMSIEAGGFLLPHDAFRVRARADQLASVARSHEKF